MISYIKGTLEYIGENDVILETGGIGYHIYVSQATTAHLPSKGNQIMIYTYMNVKEDAISLYGFRTVEELNLFHKLITVSGVGPKGGLSFLSQMSPKEIVMAIVSDDVKTLCKTPGIGKKIAQRVILELKDKFQVSDGVLETIFASEGQLDVSETSPKLEAIEALTALGYSRSEAVQAVDRIYDTSLTTEDLLKFALKSMVK